LYQDLRKTIYANIYFICNNWIITINIYISWSFNPNGFGWIYVLIPFIIGLCGSIVCLYRYWTYGRKEIGAIDF